MISFCDWASRRSPRHVSFDFEILQFFLGVVAWCSSTFASMSIVNSFSGWKDSVISIWFRRPPRKPPDGFDSSVLRIACSQWPLSVHSPKTPRPVDCWVETTAPIIVFNYPSIHQVYSDSESFLDAHSIYIIGPASVDPCSMGAPQQTHASKPSTDDNSWSTIAFSKF